LSKNFRHNPTPPNRGNIALITEASKCFLRDPGGGDHRLQYDDREGYHPTCSARYNNPLLGVTLVTSCYHWRYWIPQHFLSLRVCLQTYVPVSSISGPEVPGPSKGFDDLCESFQSVRSIQAACLHWHMNMTELLYLTVTARSLRLGV